MYSGWQGIEYGVPQGSILGPLLFMIYVNDLPHYIQNAHIHLYADDTAISVSGKTPVELENGLNKQLAIANKWLRENQLTLNTEKTKYMLFGTNVTLNKMKDVTVKSNDTAVQRVTKYKYLGFMLDERLDFKEHAKYIRAKVIPRLKMLGKMTNILS